MAWENWRDLKVMINIMSDPPCIMYSDSVDSSVDVGVGEGEKDKVRNVRRPCRSAGLQVFFLSKL